MLATPAGPKRQALTPSAPGGSAAAGAALRSGRRARGAHTGNPRRQRSQQHPLSSRRARRRKGCILASAAPPSPRKRRALSRYGPLHSSPPQGTGSPALLRAPARYWAPRGRASSLEAEVAQTFSARPKLSAQARCAAPMFLPSSAGLVRASGAARPTWRETGRPRTAVPGPWIGTATLWGRLASAVCLSKAASGVHAPESWSAPCSCATPAASRRLLTLSLQWSDAVWAHCVPPPRGRAWLARGETWLPGLEFP